MREYGRLPHHVGAPRPHIKVFAGGGTREVGEVEEVGGLVGSKGGRTGGKERRRRETGGK